MSYVLDALRRAEAERQRGRVPGLDAQTLPTPGAATGPARRPTRALWAVGLPTLAVLLAAAAWWWTAPAAVPATPVPVELPAAAPPQRPAPPLAVAPSPPPPPVQVARPAPPPVPAQAPDARPVTLQNLPEAERRQFPALAFGGAIDSPQREARMLIINGQVWREGEEPQPGLRLERITLRVATFRWRERVVEVPL